MSATSAIAATNSQASPFRDFVDRPLKKVHPGSWWICEEQYFYAVAKTQARRMRITETSTAAFAEPIGSRTKRTAAVDDVE